MIDSKPIVYLLTAVVYGWCPALVQSQVGGGPGIGTGIGTLPVPIAECSCTLPHDKDFCCDASQVWCRRVDSPPIITVAGTAITVGETRICTNSAGCPDNPPSGDLTCNLGTSLARTTSATATIDSNITVGIPEIKASLGSALGVPIGPSITISPSCSYPTPPCMVATIQGTLVGTVGIKAEITHQWTTGGTWANKYSWCTCSINSSPWQQPCGSGISTGTADLWADGTCSLLSETDCAATK